MKKIFLPLVFCTLTAQGAPVRVDLPSAFRFALERTESVAVENSRLQQTEAQQKQALATVLPNLALEADYFRQKAPTTATRSDQTTAQLTLRQSLFQGSNWANLSRARNEIESGQQSVLNSKVILFSEVARAYYELLAAEQDQKNLRTSVTLTSERVTDLQQWRKIGRSRPGELFTAQSQLALLQSNLLASEQSLEVARDRFAYVTGLGRDSFPHETIELPSKLENLDSYLSKISHRPDIASLTASAAAVEDSVRAAWAGHLPSLDFTGNYYLKRARSQENIDWDLTVGLSFPLFAGGIVSARTQEARARENEADLRLQQAKREAELQVRTAYTSLQNNIAQITSLEQAYAATEKNYRQQNRDYRLSLVTNLDVLQAISLFQETKRSLDRTRYTAALAWAELRAAVAQIP